MELSEFLPDQLRTISLQQNDIPRIAKTPVLMQLLENASGSVPTSHCLICGDARTMDPLCPQGVHLIVTSPPYWTLKEYREHPDQLGHITSYELFLGELEKVWKTCFDLLVPGGRLICVVGDVCLSRRKNGGRHAVMPLHASIQEMCRNIGYDNLAPIIWNKISNAAYEVNGQGGFLGKPYEPNAVIKNDIEYILMQRKSGGYRTPEKAARLLSIISEKNHQQWFQQIWTGLTGASTREHPAPYPLELAERLIRMFSFVGDTVLDPFVGTGTTTIASAKWGRNSIGYEVDPHYFELCCSRVKKATLQLFQQVQINILNESTFRDEKIHLRESSRTLLEDPESAVRGAGQSSRNQGSGESRVCNRRKTDGRIRKVGSSIPD
ncbi:MAG: DNA-methyltransferase [Thermoguttaceae bacterium]